MPVRVKDPTDIQSAYDEHADPTRTTSQGLEAAEKAGSGIDYDSNSTDPYVTQGLDQLEAYANDSSNWANNVSPSKQSVMSRGQKALRFFKKSGPTMGVTGGLTGVIIAIAMTAASSVGVMFQHVTAGLVNMFDTRGVTSTYRTNKILVKKITGDTTTGSCNTVKIMCRYGRPSNKLLRNLEKQGVIALDSNGKKITSNGIFPNGKPSTYELTRSDGRKLSVEAKDFAKTFSSDVEFRKAFHTAYNSRFQNFADSVFLKVASKFGFSKADSLADVTDEADVKDKVNTASEGEDIGAKAAKEGAGEVADEVVEKVAKEEVTDMTQKLARSAKADAKLLIIGIGCTVADVPGLASKIARGYQMGQLIKYAMVFLTVADKIKAGDATSTEVNALGAILTTTYKDSSGNITSRAAVDSFGMKYALFGDTDTSQQSTGHDYKKFSPGGSIVSSLSDTVKITDSKAKKDLCNAASNPLTGLALHAAVGSTGVGLAEEALTAAVGWAAGWALEQAAEPLVNWGMGLLKASGIIETILGGLLGDLTANLIGEDAGNAFVSGAAHMFSQSASAGGNLPLSTADAIAFNQTKTQINLAYAEEDRVGRSPFDISSPNTFLGSIATRLIPYSSQMASISGIFSTISSLSLGSLATIFSPATKAYSGQEYSLCSDTGINDGTTAVGPFCNIVYGIPNKYLGAEPTDVAEYMVNSGQVDEDTGDAKPGSEYETWMGACLDGKTDQAQNCQLDGTGTDAASASKFANYALYTVDHQVQKDMDGEDTVADPGSTSPTPSGKCPTGTTKDYGTQKGYDNGKEIDIVTCGIIGWPANFENSAGDKIIEVNAEIADDTVRLAQALKDTGYNFARYTSIGFRTNEQQACIYQQFLTHKKGCSPFNSIPPAAAKPGYSNHQMGYSIDMSGTQGTTIGRWLDAHMGSYGFSRDVSGDYGHMTHKH